MMASTSVLSLEAFEYAARHVFLVPKLPQEEDFDPSHERKLLYVVLSAMERFKGLRHSTADFQHATNMVRIMISSRPGAFLDLVQVGNAFKSLPEGGYIAFELRSQNFGILVHRGQDIIRFEQFELLARNEDVVNCKGRLLRRFPALVRMLVELDHTTHPTCRPMLAKGGKEQIEERDTINPRLIALLTGFLRGLGRQGCSTPIMKHSREEALWADARVSWHRSASWMFLRICLQLVLGRGCEAVQSCLYKEFMAFLMSELLQQALSMDIPDHLVYCMVAKVNRRFLKLSSILTCSPGWFAVSSKVVEQAGSKLATKWTAIQEADKRPVDLQTLKNLRFDEDTALRLVNLKPYLDWISDSSRNSERIDSANLEGGFSFKRAEPYTLPNFDPLKVGALAEHIQCYTLADFENWVAENLREWLLAHIDQSNTCEDLARLIDDYYRAAKLRYENNPVNLSTMWITIMELWVACDKTATKLYPLLKDHRVGFPEGLLEPLLLPIKSQMTRLREVENYLATRHCVAKPNFPSAFEGFGDKNSFAARFYETSKQHQELHQQILTSAEKARAAKLEELTSKNEQYSYLKRCHDSVEHQLVDRMTRHGGWIQECAWDCPKCRPRMEMKKMRISVHEWPLPKKEIHAKVVVFELQVPSAIVAWRRVTLALMVDMLKDPENKPIPTDCPNLYWALEYPDLKPHAWSRGTCRLQLASVVKPFTRAHYKDIAVAEASEDSVCKNHGCQYDYYDFTHRSQISEVIDEPVIPPECSFAHLSNLIRWIDELLNRKAASDSESERNDLNLRILGMALICARTFDVEPVHFSSIFSFDEASSCYIKASITINNHTLKEAPLPPLMFISLQSWRRLSYQALPSVSAKINSSRHILDNAIKAFWEAYTPGTPWSPMGKDRDHILKSHSATTTESSRLPVSLNLLDGSLLVNGRPLSRLPKEFQDHPTYTRLFGTQILEIVPSEFPLMDFSAARNQNGWVVHFAMIGDGLTGRTGTEEALRILKSAAVVSFERLENEDIRLLSDVARLSPRRQFYPPHLRVMQTVNWSTSLDPLAQSEEFSWVVRSILKRGENCEMFFPDDAEEIPELNLTDVDLQARALVRCSTFRVSGFGAEDHTASFDTLYNGRDTISGSIIQLEQYVCQITKILLAEQQVMLEHVSGTLLDTLYKVMGHRILGPTSQSTKRAYRFNSQWLDEPTTSIGEDWGRCQSAWESKLARIRRVALPQLERQWPTSCPSYPNVDDFDRYFDATSVMVEIRRHFASWERNLQLRKHLQTAISIVKRLQIASATVPQYAAPGDELDSLISRRDLAFVPIARLIANEPPRIICEPPPSFDDYYSHVAKEIPVGAGNDDKERLLHLLLSLRVRASRVHEHEYVDELEKSFRSSQINTDADKMAQFAHDDSMLRTTMKKYVETCRCQRSERLLAAVGNTNQLAAEMKNVGHTWDPMVLPESLLLEVESGIMIREVQEKIAAPMRNPGQNNNSVMQLNMGEGKSSVIVQIVAASLADGTRLVRIIVAKPQSKQMRHMLVTKLGGLLDRQVFFMPFSRSIAMDAAKIQQIRRTLTECMENGGVLLVQPEHLLSFKLMGIEHIGCSPVKASAYSTETNPDPTSASGVASTKAESYSVGIEVLKTQKFLDQHCRDIIDESDENFSVKFELIYTIGLQAPVEMSPERWVTIQNVLSLVRQCATEVQKSASDGIQLQSAEAGQFATLRILKEPAGNLLLQRVARALCEKGVHGLPIAHQKPAIREGVLSYILDDRPTNDNAFLDQNDENGFFCRATKDVLLLLRGLFAGGVLKFALSQKRWRVNYGLAERKPPKLVAVPYRAKDNPAPRAEFSHPDIVIVLTCLSYYYGGLCDAQLFTSFEHLQRSDQASEEFANWVKGSAELPAGFHQLTSINLKDLILDVGALIVDLDNEQVARSWLGLSPAHDKQAAIFVNDKDELLVLNRGGFIEPFLTSPFVGDTKDCLVFLDEAHTRGIDLKLPDDYRAAVTLGPRLTKDRLVQACMRMRKLGRGQSVTFFIPQEIQERIRNCASLDTNAPLTVTGVLLWSISETWTDTEKSIPLWAMQGFRHQRQEVIWNNKIAHGSELTLESSDLQGYFEDETMSLEQRYLPSHQTPGYVFSSLAADKELTQRKEQVDRIRATCERYQIASFSSATLSEEQERELAPEMERERQAERPKPVEPKRHTIHRDVRELVRRGNLNLHGGGFLPAFRSFNRSTARRFANPEEFGQDLLVTTDFARLVDLTPGSHSDAFHRSVQWVLTFKNGTVRNQFLVILSPWEANELFLEIDKSSHVYLHSYAARRNLSFPTLQDLKLCTIPSIPPDWTPPPKSLILQLNIFAGQLYFEDMTEYKETCAFLGLSYVPNDGSVTVRADGFVGKGTLYPQCRFTQSPSAFLRVVMSNIRRECQDISRTHVGRMLAGEILSESDFNTDAR
ncbi:hypothetical protein DL765_000286 [Monosporascus sp. GIB2]|nr:hypothetical protein DL765_000286 [Monosporascus sp. GIB2]